jgi:hypothetical protein
MQATGAIRFATEAIDQENEKHTLIERLDIAFDALVLEASGRTPTMAWIRVGSLYCGRAPAFTVPT